MPAGGQELGRISEIVTEARLIAIDDPLTPLARGSIVCRPELGVAR
jgi:hypothetical protein